MPTNIWIREQIPGILDHVQKGGLRETVLLPMLKLEGQSNEVGTNSVQKLRSSFTQTIHNL